VPPLSVKTAVLVGANPARTCDLSQGQAMKATAFLLGFAIVWTPILIYAVWVTWRIAGAI
jgi:hypothetical protein